MLRKIILMALCYGVTADVVYAQATPYTGLLVGKGRGDNVEVFAGFGESFGQHKQFYLGTELGLDILYIHGHSYTFAGELTSYREKLFSALFHLLPGLNITDFTMLYTRFGMQYWFSGKVAYSDFNSQIGVGLQTKLNTNWNFRAEFSFSSETQKAVSVGLVYKF